MIDGLLAGYLLANLTVYLRRHNYRYRILWALLESFSIFVISAGFWVALLLLVNNYNSALGGAAGRFSAVAACSYFATLRSFSKEDFPEFSVGKIFWGSLILVVFWGWSFYSGYSKQQDHDSAITAPFKNQSQQAPTNTGQISPQNKYTSNNYQPSLAPQLIQIQIEGGNYSIEDGGLIAFHDFNLLIENNHTKELAGIEFDFEIKDSFGDAICKNGIGLQSILPPNEARYKIYKTIPRGQVRIYYGLLRVGCNSILRLDDVMRGNRSFHFTVVRVAEQN